MPFNLKERFASVKAGRAFSCYTWLEVSALRDLETDPSAEFLEGRPPLPAGDFGVPRQLVANVVIGNRCRGRRLVLLARNREEADPHLEPLRALAIRLGLDGAHAYIQDERSSRARLANIALLLNTRGHTVEPRNRLQLMLGVASGKAFGALLGFSRSLDPRRDILALCRDGTLTFDLDVVLTPETLIRQWEGGDEQ
ncbi:hypothetical protein UAJ10_07180 [Nitrospirillum sp. BR 11164]|uniref:hypothetical protein n=1 Tax=Nitrospirillum sp. BR 11164 TaxID=3104324 RepID=UPI002B002C2A|nr:hypothetical protein [Nitrospirillum sp. BR 11164]MEA1648797.1 hypothetical protein [Nitrospirillum sp. BR 11164]